jgi:hypothetical protein
MDNGEDQQASIEQPPGFHLIITGQLSSVEVPMRMPLATADACRNHAVKSRRTEPLETCSVSQKLSKLSGPHIFLQLGRLLQIGGGGSGGVS